MEENLIKNILSRLDRQSFKSFALDFFKNTNSELNEIKEIGSNDIYYEGIMDSYGESLHTVFIFDYLPLEIFSKRGFIEIARPSIESLIQKVGKHYKGKIGYWGMVSPKLKKQGSSKISLLSQMFQIIQGRNIMKSYSPNILKYLKKII